MVSGGGTNIVNGTYPALTGGFSKAMVPGPLKRFHRLVGFEAIILYK